MGRKSVKVLALVALAVALALPAWAQGTGSTRLRAFEEVPAISSPGDGQFSARINGSGTSLSYQLSYRNLQGTVTQSHIHIAQRGVNGGIMIFLCSNLGNGPAGTQACPADPATISGAITAADVLAINGQDLEPGNFREFQNALRQGFAYANVHSTLWPGGELRGQIRRSEDDDRD